MVFEQFVAAGYHETLGVTIWVAWVSKQNMTTTRQHRDNLLTEGVTIAFLTVTAYSVGFAYEAGFAGYFGIPFELIAISTNLLLKVAAALLLGILSYVGIAITVWQFVPRSETLLAKKARGFIAVVFLIGLALSPFLLQGEGWIALLVLVGFFAFFDFVFPLITQSNKHGYLAKVDAQEKLEREAYPHTLMGVFSSWGGRIPIMLIAGLGLAAVFAFGLGTQNAKSKVEYFLLDGKTDDVILAIYGDVYVSSKFDSKSRSLKGGLTVQKLADGKAITLQFTKIGPLKAPPPSASYAGMPEKTAAPLSRGDAQRIIPPDLSRQAAPVQ